MQLKGLFENQPECVLSLADDGSLLEMNPAGLRLIEADSFDQVVDQSIYPHVSAEHRPAFRELAEKVFSGGSDRLEFQLIGLKGNRRWLEISASPLRDTSGPVTALLGITRDITERKQAEGDRQTHLSFFECLDKVNRAIQGTSNLDQMMSDVLDTTLAIFSCDRAWLVYPCDPEAASWHAPMERTKPEYPGALARGLELPMTPEVATVLQLLRDAPVPVKFGPETAHPVPSGVAQGFGVQSFIAMALHPKTGKPWIFGLHQCAHPRVWTANEERLFQEIGRRLADALTSLLAYHALRESEGRLAEAERLAQVGYWERDYKAGRMILSDEAYRILGIPPEQRITDLDECDRQWLEAVHPEDRPNVMAAAEAALREGTKYDVEYRLTRPDGELRIIHSYAEVTKDEAGQPRRMLGTMLDITAHKQAEAALRTSEERLRLAVQASDVGLWDWDQRTNQVVFSREWKSQLGYEEQEIANEFGEWERRVHPDDLVPTLVALRGYLDGRQPEYAVEFRLRHKDETYRWIYARGEVFRDAEGRPLRMLGCHVDITARKQTEAALHKSETNYRSVVTAMAEGVVFQAANGEITTINPAAEKIEDRLDKQMLGRTSDDPCWGAIHEDGTPFPGDTHPAMVTLRTGQPQSDVIMGIHTPAGALKWISINSQPLIAETGQKPYAVVTTFHDITARKHAEDELRLSSADLQLALDAGRMGNWKWNLLTGEVVWSATCKSLYGLPLEDELSHEQFLARVHPEDREQVDAALNQAVTTGSDYETEKRVVWPDGSVHWNATRGRVLCDHEGRPIQMSGVTMDISARKQAEETLQASVARMTRQESALIVLSRKGALLNSEPLTALRRITEVSARTLDVQRVSVWRFNADRTAIRCVDLYELQENRHSSGMELAVAEFPAYFRALAECDAIVADDALEDSRTRELSVKYLTPLGITSMMDAPTQFKGMLDGVVCHEHVGPKRQWKADERTFTIAIASIASLALEESERSQAEQALRRSNLAYASLVNTIDGIVWEADAETFRFLFVSQQAEKMLGYPAERWMTDPGFWRDHIHPQDRNWAVDYCVRATKLKQDHDFQYRMIAADGRVVWLHDLVTVVTEADRAVKLRGIMVDITESKRGEEALRLFRALIDHTNDAIEVIDPETGQYLDVNEKACQSHGYSRQEYLALRVHEVEVKLSLIGADDWQKHVADIRKTGFKTIEGQHRRRDGSVFPVEVSINYIQLDRDYLLAVVRDITERKRTEQALRDSEERFRELAETIQEVFWITDPAKHRMLYVSPAYETIWGRTCQSLYETPQSWLDAVHPDDRARVLHAAMTRQIEGTYDEEYRIIRPDGQMRWIRDQAFPVRNAAGQVERVVGVARSITERKQALEALRESQGLLEKAQQVGRIGSWVSTTALEGKLIWSAETCRIFGFAPDEFNGRVEDFYALVHPGDRENVARAAQAALSGERPYDLEHRIVRRDGQTRWVHEQADVERDAAGRLVRMVGVVQDITERRQLEDQFRQSQKMEAIGQLAGGVAHDFNNILTGMIMQTELTEMAENLSQDAREGLQQIRAAAERAASLTRQLLLFSRKQLMQPRELDLNEVVTSLAKMLQRIIGEDVRLQLHLQPAQLMTRADAGMLDQVLMNLTVNARDAMPAGGCLLIETTKKTLTKDSAHLHPDAAPGNYVCLSVSDTGDGIPPEILSRIFEPFFTTKEPGKGTGLGLATVFGIVKQHGGSITVESKTGRGTTFQVMLPATGTAAKSSDETTPRARPRGGTETILLVEDDSSVRLLTSTLLERAGYKVLAASDGVQAQRIWEQQPDSIRLLLTDIVMPEGVSGRELAARLQAKNPKLRVIFTSGYSSGIAGQELALQEGQNFIQKPASSQQVLESVRRSLDS